MSLPREVELVLDYCVGTMLTEWKELRSKPGFSIDEPIDEKAIASELVVAENILGQYMANTPARTVLVELDNRVQAGKRKRSTPRPTIISGAFCVDSAPPLSVTVMITTQNPNEISWGSARLRIAPDSLVYQLRPSSFGRVEVSASASRIWIVDDRTLMRRTVQRLEAEKIVQRNWPRLTGNQTQERLKNMVLLQGLGQPSTPAQQRDDALAHLRGRSVSGVTSFVAAAIAMNLPLDKLLEEP
jgi:hypothetical protein